MSTDSIVESMQMQWKSLLFAFLQFMCVYVNVFRLGLKSNQRLSFQFNIKYKIKITTSNYLNRAQQNDLQNHDELICNGLKERKSIK